MDDGVGEFEVGDDDAATDAGEDEKYDEGLFDD